MRRGVASQAACRVKLRSALASKEEGPKILLRLDLEKARLLAHAVSLGALVRLVPARERLGPGGQEDVELRVDGVGALRHLLVNHARADALLEEGDVHRLPRNALRALPQQERLVLGGFKKALAERQTAARECAPLVLLEGHLAIDLDVAKPPNLLPTRRLAGIVTAGLMSPIVKELGVVVASVTAPPARHLEERPHLYAVLELGVHLDAAIQQVAKGGVAHADPPRRLGHHLLLEELLAGHGLDQQLVRRLRLRAPRAAAVRTKFAEGGVDVLLDEARQRIHHQAVG